MSARTYIPFEDWPEHAWRAIRGAHADKAAAPAARVHAQVPPRTTPIDEAALRDARAQSELAFARRRGMTIAELEQWAPAELRPDPPFWVIPTERLLRWAKGNLDGG